MAERKSPLKAIKSFLIISFVSIALIACGGGELPDEAADEAAPDIANLLPIAIIIASPENAAFGEGITLDGSLSSDPDGDAIASYTWSQVNGEPIDIIGPDQTVASFVAPDTETIITIQLIVTDSAGNQSAPATADITVTDDGTPPDVEDDVPLTAVYVSKALGIDTNSGTYRRPVATVSRGVEIAAANGLANIFIMEGTYVETVTLQGGQSIRGCAASWDASGAVQYAASNATTIIQAPAGAEEAIKADGITGTQIQCLSILGGSAAMQSFGVLVHNSQDIDLTDVSVSTPGVAGGLCRDVEIQGSQGVAIASAAFKNSGLCNDYIAVSATNSQEISLDSNLGAITVTLDPGSEAYLKAFQAVTSDDLVLRGVSVTSSAALAPGTVFTGVALGDATNAVIEDNDFGIQGGSTAAGASLRCTGTAVHYTVSDNSFSMEDVAGGATGIRINCPVPDGEFDIERNRVRIIPEGNASVPTVGVEVEAQMRPLDISVVNNVFVMPLASSDKSDKTGIVLSNHNAASTISALHNTFLIIGSQGELHMIDSNRSNVQFRALGNIAFVYGNNANNALFRLKKACQTNYCARDVVANLVNDDFFGTPLLSAYYYDTLETEALAVINECDLGAPPPQCGLGEVDHSANQIVDLIVPYFDLAAGELTAANQALAKDLGPLGTGVIDDVDGALRTDGLPDIGATEY